MPRGGSRKGAGRPTGTTKPDKKQSLHIKIKPALIEWLRKQPLGIGPTIEALIQKEIHKN